MPSKYPPAMLDALRDSGVTFNDDKAGGEPSGVIVHGAGCTWWDGIEKASTLPSGKPKEPGLPCCPFCHSVLLQFDNEAAFLAGTPEYEANGHPGYTAMIKWARGRCFRTLVSLAAAYKEATGIVVPV